MPWHVRHLHSTIARRIWRLFPPFTFVLVDSLRIRYPSLDLGVHSGASLAKIHRAIPGERHQGAYDV